MDSIVGRAASDRPSPALLPVLALFVLAELMIAYGAALLFAGLPHLLAWLAGAE